AFQSEVNGARRRSYWELSSSGLPRDRHLPKLRVLQQEAAVGSGRIALEKLAWSVSRVRLTGLI
ncbi:hypothetical protein LINGRAHAP2_LOCUS30483, partial [Linum grandiflorum]